MTYRYRIKDGAQKRYLSRLGRTVNFVWNYCNNAQKHALRWSTRWPSAFDLNNLTSGSAKELGLHSASVQAVCERFAKSREQHKKRFLRYRGKKALGWIPFKASGLRQVANGFKFNGRIFKVWLSRPVLGDIKCGSFAQDSLGRWYINITCEVSCSPYVRDNYGETGIDLGLKDFLTCSNGEKVEAKKLYRNSEPKLAMAQRAGKKKLVKKIALKIKNQRKDFQHKLSTKLVKENVLIVVGNVSSSGLAKTNMAKSVLDAGLSQFRTMLEYKALAHHAWFLEVNERYTTQTCSSCGARPPERPRGIAGLGIREWICSACNTWHDRDVNAAKNILRLGRETLAEGIPAL